MSEYKGLRPPNRFEIDLFISEYKSLSNDLVSELSKFGYNIIRTMKEKGVSKDFDFSEMARAAFKRQIENTIGGIRAKEEAEKILKG